MAGKKNKASSSATVKKPSVRDLAPKRDAKGGLGDTATHEVGHWVGLKSGKPLEKR